MGDENKRLCLYCKHWNFDAGEPGYSEMTPGTDWNSSCMVGLWEMSGYDVSEDEFASNIEKGLTCSKFERKKAAA